MSTRELRFDTIDQVRLEVEQLRRAGYERAGQWDLAQACDHLAYLMEGSLDGFTIQVAWLIRARFGWAVLHRILPQKKTKPGVPAPQENIAPPNSAEAAAVERFCQVVRRFEAQQGDDHASPLFGYLTRGPWRELHLIHGAHHLGFLRPRREA